MRIVSLCPSLTELVFDLGRGRDLVGITDYCVHPEAEVAAIEKVGGTKTPNIARIIDLAPDLVLVNDEENRLEDADALGRAGLLLLSTMPRDPEETAEMVRSIGSALDRPQAAEKIARRIEERAAEVRRTAGRGRPVRFAYLIWRKPWMAVGGDTFAHSLLALAGGINIFADSADRYPEVTAAELGRADPEVVLLGTEPFPFTHDHLRELATASELDAERFRIVDGEYLSWHGSRTVAGIGYAAGVIADVRDARTAC